MASSSSPARLYHYLLLLVLLLTTTLPSSSVHGGSPEDRRGRVEAPAALPPAVAPGRRARQEFHVAPRTMGPAARGGRRGGGGTGAWTFSAMLPRGFVPPSGSSACHNGMPDTATDSQFFACSGAGTP